MRIALIGYGKMGKAIEEVVNEEGRHEIVLKITESNKSEFNVSNLKLADVAIDFTEPSAAYGNVLLCFEANIPIVVGTTSWEDGLEKAKKLCLENNQTLFTSPNFSIGVNLFFSTAFNNEVIAIDGIITSLFLGNLSALTAKYKADVPLLQVTPYFLPQYEANAISNSSICGP